MPSAVSRSKLRSAKESSPATSQNKNTRNNKDVAWTEPAPQTGKPSYEEHGGSAFGVLEDMQALGQKPSSKVKTRVRSEPSKKQTGRGQSSVNANGGSTDSRSNTPIIQNEAEKEPTIAEQSVPSTEFLADLSKILDRLEQDYLDLEGKMGTVRYEIAKHHGGKVGVTILLEDMYDRYQDMSDSALSKETPHGNDLPALPDYGDPATWAAGLNKTDTIYRFVHKLEESNDESVASFVLSIRQCLWDDERGVNLVYRYIYGVLTESETLQLRNLLLLAEGRRIEERRRGIDRFGYMTFDCYRDDRLRIAAEIIKDIKEQREMIERQVLKQKDQKQHTLSSGLGSQAGKTLDHPTSNGQHSTTTQVTQNNRSSAHVSCDSNKSVKGKVKASSRVQQESSPLPSRSPEPSHKASIVQSSTLHANKSLNGHNEATIRPIKRSPIDAGLEDDEREAAELTKRRKLAETTFKDGGPTAPGIASHIRETVETGRVLRARGPVDYRPIMRVSNGINEKPVPEREASDSPLSDVSASPPKPATIPRISTDAVKSRKAQFHLSPGKPQISPYAINKERESSDDLSPIVDSSDDMDSDDTHVCNSCKEPGWLICCEGCERAFHSHCLDPPLTMGNSMLEDAYYCHVCLARRQPPKKQPRGLFASLLQTLEKRNPVVFSLPEQLKCYFRDVATGKDGNFEDPANLKTRGRVGYDEPLDLFKTKDSKGNFILCFHCGRSSAGKREVITCDVCSKHWHLDCLTPPLANPPFRDQWNRKNKDWMCPLHIEHDLARIDPARLASQRRIHIRRPKASRVVDTSLRRGQVNNGDIEIMEDSSSEDDSEFDDDETSSGVIHRLPAKGVKLDFIDKVKRIQIAESHKQDRPIDSGRLEISREVLGVGLGYDRYPELPDKEGRVDYFELLVKALIEEAPPELIRAAKAERDNPTKGISQAGDVRVRKGTMSESTRRELISLQKLIAGSLEDSSDDSE